MKTTKPAERLSILAGLCVVIALNSAPGAVTPLNFPTEISNRVTVHFDGPPDYTIANTLFSDWGVQFTRDDGYPIYLMDWTAHERLTSSPSNVLATIRNVSTDPTWVTHLNILAAYPLYAIGANFGNDQNESDFATIRLSVYGAAGELLGSVDKAANHNTHVDQFIGLRSDVPFTRARLDNLTPSGTPSGAYSVVIDDLTYTSNPNPSDRDGDGVPDGEDRCPDTMPGAITDEDGCSIDQLTPCAGPAEGGRWKNHGRYVSEVARTARAFAKRGLITAKQRHQLVSAATKSSCGRQPWSGPKAGMAAGQTPGDPR